MWNLTRQKKGCPIPGRADIQKRVFSDHADITGQEITSKLLYHARKRKNITIEEHTMMVDIISKDNICEGILVKKQNQEMQAIFAKEVVFATGGIGGLFRHSTNYPDITGDALAIAIRHRIELQDINYIQIHPTSLYSKDTGRRFLISESVRGEGAVLVNLMGSDSQMNYSREMLLQPL